MTPRTWLLTMLAVGGLCSAGCHNDEVTGPGNHQSLPPSSAIAIRLKVDVVRGEVTVMGSNAKPSESWKHVAQTVKRPSFAILGGREVGVATSNFFRSAVDEFLPGKVRIRFDIALSNLLAGATFVTPTFPRPPLGEQSLQLAPFSISQINDIGAVTASTDWDAGPHNFFNDAVCGAETGSDCSRYEPYPSPLGPGQTSAAQTIGFDIDPQVRTFQLDLLLAADLANEIPPTQEGGVRGTVNSPQRGNLIGVTVTATPGGRSSFTSLRRAGLVVDVSYVIGHLTPGEVTLTLSTLPEGCTDPGPQTATVAAEEITTVDFTVTCDATAGSIQGTLSSAERGPLLLNGITVTASPGGQSATAEPSRTRVGVVTRYFMRDVEPGEVTLTLSTLPEGCTDPGPQTVTVVAGELTPAPFTITCTPPASIAGFVLSPERGPLVGVTAMVSPGGQTGVTEATPVGIRYLVEDVAPGEATITLSTLPVGCTDPGPQTVVATAGAVTSVDFSVTCTGLGTIVGFVSSLDRGPLVGVTVTAAPSGQSGATTEGTDASIGTPSPYRIEDVPAGFVTLTLTNLPDGCFDPGSQAVTVAAEEVTTVNFDVTSATGARRAAIRSRR